MLRIMALVTTAPVSGRAGRTIRRFRVTVISGPATGKTGTGKEGAAQAIHEASDRASGPFIVIDCGAIPSALLEAELFGHEAGAFTGAVSRRIGAFEQASGGVLFLDEIGELPAELQPKL